MVTSARDGATYHHESLCNMDISAPSCAASVVTVAHVTSGIWPSYRHTLHCSDLHTCPLLGVYLCGHVSCLRVHVCWCGAQRGSTPRAIGTPAQLWRQRLHYVSDCVNVENLKFSVVAKVSTCAAHAKRLRDVATWRVSHARVPYMLAYEPHNIAW